MKKHLITKLGSIALITAYGSGGGYEPSCYQPISSPL